MMIIGTNATRTAVDAVMRYPQGQQIGTIISMTIGIIVLVIACIIFKFRGGFHERRK
jgi:xanthine/uracil permease